MSGEEQEVWFVAHGLGLTLHEFRHSVIYGLSWWCPKCRDRWGPFDSQVEAARDFGKHASKCEHEGAR